jgi:DNA-binding ferritin-like protein (Dps family)
MIFSKTYYNILVCIVGFLGLISVIVFQIRSHSILIKKVILNFVFNINETDLKSFLILKEELRLFEPGLDNCKNLFERLLVNMKDLENIDPEILGNFIELKDFSDSYKHEVEDETHFLDTQLWDSVFIKFTEESTYQCFLVVKKLEYAFSITADNLKGII